MIGTAGHVDHGKTALVKALTGVDTDRLPEEKAREISIELGFAPLTLPDGTVASVVDVPGHERFIKQMVAGATGVDIILLVVDAREGPGAQTREHLDILDLLGVHTAVVALAKTDTVAPAAVGEAAASVSSFLEGTPFAGSPVIPVSSRTGEGLPRLLEALRDAVEQAGSAGSDTGPARLSVDRAFHVQGFGPVVTGTVASGRIGEGQRLEVYPEGGTARVRRVEVHGRQVGAAAAGDRAALNLAGDVEFPSLRGAVLAAPGSLEVSVVVGLGLRLLETAKPVADLERVRLHAGTAEILGRLILLDGRKELTPGDTLSPEGRPAEVAVVFEAERPVALAPGQKFVIRSYSPPRTIGGGSVWVADLTSETGPRPRALKSRRAAAAGLARAAASSPGARRVRVRGGFAPMADFLEAAGLKPAPPVPGVRVMAGGRYVADEQFYEEVRDDIKAKLSALHNARPHLAWAGGEAVWSLLKERGLPPAVWLDTLASDGVVRLDAGRIRLAGRAPLRPAALEDAMERLAARLREGWLSPPSTDQMMEGMGPAHRAAATAALEVLLEEGTAVSPSGPGPAMAGGPVFHRDAIAEAEKLLRDYLQANPEITVAAFRDLTGSTRKYALPLLEYFDRRKVTLRRGDVRVPHPAQSRPAAAREAAR